MIPVLAWLGLLACCIAGRADTAPVTDDEALLWMRHVLPLPHEITIQQSCTVPRGEVAVRLGPDLGDIGEQAALREVFGDGQPQAPAFEIVIGLVEGGAVLGVPVPDAERLATLPNPEQAYLIRPDGDHRLILAASDPRGLYYASRTLLQLLTPKLTDERVTLPLLAVTDWPDIEERGLWNFPLDLISWLSDMKLNFAKIPTYLETIERGKPVRIRPVDQEFLRQARACAFNPVLTSTHLNFLHRHGLNAAYPELVGKGERAKCPYKYKVDGATAPCASNPLLQQIIADWLRGAAEQGGEEVSVWLTEFYAQCECEQCLKHGQFQLETKATLAAFEQVRQEHPQLKLRIFFTLRRTPEELQASRECLAMVPPEVKVEIVYGTTEPFAEAAKAGGWVGDYAAPYLTRGGCTGLLTYPSWMRSFLQTTATRKYRGAYAISYLYSSAAYHRALYDQQISALAEWSWNLNGRDVREFALAWATRRGYADPEAAAEYVLLMDPIGHSLIQSAHSVFAPWTEAPARVRARKVLAPGEDMLWAFRTADGFDQTAGQCRQARAIAERIGDRRMVLEALYVESLVEAMRGVHLLTVAAAQEPISPEAVRTALAGFEARVAELLALHDELADGLGCEPAAFAADMKKEHHQRWETRLQALRAAVEEILK